jgi:hypothetical protein
MTLTSFRPASDNNVGRMPYNVIHYHYQIKEDEKNHAALNIQIKCKAQSQYKIASINRIIEIINDSVSVFGLLCYD